MLSTSRALARAFSSSAAARAHRAVAYTQNGEPSSVLSARTFPADSLRAPDADGVTLKYLLAPINPADINVVQGVYPAKPAAHPTLSSGEPGAKADAVYVAGNEGLAEVVETGPEVTGLQTGDWVILTKPQSGTWASAGAVKASDVLKVPKDVPGFSAAHAATLTVNPPTAWNMLKDFVDLKEGDWVIQNGANSAVGQCVIQLAKHRGLKTINFIRRRQDLVEMTARLKGLGATHVFTNDEATDKTIAREIKDLTEPGGARLLLDCVGGKETAHMARLLAPDAHVVTYGAMSKQPLALPASLFIFKNLTHHGFWQSRWYGSRSRAEREEVLQALITLIADGKLNTPEHEVFTLPGGDSDEQATKRIRDIMTRIAEGYGKKVLLKIEGTPD